VAVAATAPSGATARPGNLGHGRILLVNGRVLSPAGRQRAVRPMPLNLALSPDGRRLLVTADGRGIQFLQVLSARTLRPSQRIGYAAPRGLFVGITYSNRGRRVFASGGGQNVIHVLRSSPSGQLTGLENIDLKLPWQWNPFPIGLAATDNDRLLMVAEDHANAVAVIQLATGRIVARAPVGLMPYSVVAGSRPNVAYVSDWGGSSVSVIDTSPACATRSACSVTVSRPIAIGSHPSAMAVAGGDLYVADSNSDRITIISTQTNTVVGAVSVSLYPGAPLGSSPEGLALSPDNRYLYVANAGDNAVDVVRLSNHGRSGQVAGRIPTADYPTAVALSPDGRRLYVADAFGDGPRPNVSLPKGHFNDQNGIIQSIAVPSGRALQRDTAQVSQNDRTANAFVSPQPAGGPVPVPGGASPIKHIIYVIKENQTYDKVFGDEKGADGDSRLTEYGRRVTPNLHALALRFGIFDNFYDDGRSSSDGHNWVMSANDDDFNQKLWPEGYSERNEFGLDPGASLMDLSPGGYLWDSADRAGLQYRDYGEFYKRPVRDRVFLKTSQAASCGGPVASTYVGTSIPRNHVLCLPPSQLQPVAATLVGHYDVRYRGLDMRYSDIDRVAEWRREFNVFVQHNDLPALEIMWLPNDHTAADPTFLSPDSYVAQNDRALGLLVDAVSHSRYWASTAIFVTQDDPQGARDHVNSQRTEGLVISPYTQTSHPTVNSELYDNASMLRTIELILGLRPMSVFDATATPMWRAFHASTDLRPFTALPLGVPPRLNH
jgi:YVTN family beta-propeller protein